MSPDGTITELWSEMGEVMPRVLDVSPDGTRLLVSRYSYAEGVVGFHLVERELATGTETEIAQRDQYLVAKYALDNSGDLFVTNTVDEVDSTGVITKETQSLDRIANDGTEIANLVTVESMETLMWQQVMMDGELAVVIGRICKQVPPERVADVIFGYTIANDVTARDLQKAEPQWAIIPGESKIPSASSAAPIAAGRSMMPGVGPKNSPWSTATITARPRSQNSLLSLSQCPVS